MAARLNPQQDTRCREAIQTTQLVKRLSAFALNKPDDTGNIVELDSLKLRAIEILLKKTLPDLSNVEISGDAENPLTQITRIELVAATRPTRADDDAG